MIDSVLPRKPDIYEKNMSLCWNDSSQNSEKCGVVENGGGGGHQRISLKTT